MERNDRVIAVPRIELLRIMLFVVFAVTLALGGGSARADTLSLLYVRPAIIVSITGLLLLSDIRAVRSVAVPLILLGCLALIIALQLVPLPPAIWTNLPGLARFEEAALAAGVPQPWRPISLTPDLTWNSLVALLPAAGALVAIGVLSPVNRRYALLVLIALVIASAILGAIQLTAGADSLAYFYKVSHEGMPIGFLANRNHQAVWLAASFPMLRVWALKESTSPQQARFWSWAMLSSACVIALIILLTGSRAGMFIALLSMALTLLLFPVSMPGIRSGSLEKAIRISFWTVPLLLIGCTFLLGRAESFNRLLQMSDYSDENRFKNFPIVIDIIKEYWLTGTGFGSFDRVFRIFEHDSGLNPRYFNHAHNDLLELFLTGGIAAGLALAAFFAWLVIQGRRILRGGSSDQILFAKMGALVMCLLMAASLVDYPLRTPLLSAVFAMACGWFALPKEISR